MYYHLMKLTCKYFDEIYLRVCTICIYTKVNGLSSELLCFILVFIRCFGHIDCVHPQNCGQDA